MQLYVKFLNRCISRPLKTCPKCKESKLRHQDFTPRRRGNFYTTYDVCKPCHLINTKLRKKANIETYRARARKHHHRVCSAVTDGYVKRQIQRKIRYYKKTNSTKPIPSMEEQRNSLLLYRLTKIVNRYEKDGEIS